MSEAAGILLALFAAVSVGLTPTGSAAADRQTLELGKQVFASYCVLCHGDKGDGKGLTGIIHRAQQEGIVVYTYPRDFTAGLFKFRTTPTGYLPTDDDLMKIITEGIPRSGMPSHEDVSLEERKAVIAYLKTFSKRWQEEEPGTPITVGKVPSYVGTGVSVDRGRKLFTVVGCDKCHGTGGRGDGPSASELQDAWGDKILPFDFTSGALKGGTGPKDIYRTFVTGLDGTPMPSYEESLSEEQRWDIVSYCLELMKGGSAMAQR
jgi:cytochrome c oxidase cbb3-type subunit 2